jgi:hypothetical protein
MPLWQIFTDADTFTLEERTALATSITNFYTKGVHVPSFYVGVIFVPTPPDFLFVGANPTSNFVRLVIQHIEKLMPDADETGGVEYRANFMGRIRSMLSPHLEKEGLRWEINFSQAPTDLWLVQGLVPPKHGSEEETKWMEADKALEF